MKKTLAMLVATTALTAALGLPGQSAARGQDDAEAGAFTAIPDALQMPPILLASNDDDGEHDDDGDDRDEAGDDDDDDCDGNTVCNTGTNPAPSGSVPPPKNGLFGNGAAPKAQVN